MTQSASQPHNIYTQLAEILDRNDDQATRRFLAEHVKEFPHTVQRKIVALLMDEAVARHTEETEALAAIQKEIVDEFRAIIEAESAQQTDTQRDALKKEIQGGNHEGGAKE